jgi:hypothetical protein
MPSNAGPGARRRALQPRQAAAEHDVIVGQNGLRHAAELALIIRGHRRDVLAAQSAKRARWSTRRQTLWKRTCRNSGPTRWARRSARARCRPPASAATPWSNVWVIYPLAAPATQTNKTNEIKNGAARVVPRRPTLCVQTPIGPNCPNDPRVRRGWVATPPGAIIRRRRPPIHPPTRSPVLCRRAWRPQTGCRDWNTSKARTKFCWCVRRPELPSTKSQCDRNMRSQ